MKNWGNWSYSQLKSVIEKAKIDGNKSVSIDQEHTDYRNDQEVKQWLTEMGLKFDTKMERTIIYLS